MQKIILSTAIIGLLTACASTPPVLPAEQTSAKAPAPTVAVANTPDSKPKVAIDPLKDPNGELAKRSIYFGYDKYEIGMEDQAMLQRHARYLAQHPTQHLQVEGNADERGSREYNLALGQKRAEAVRHALVISGADERQLEATSNGKEKPRAQGHDEAAWSENRRADLSYPGS